MTVLNLILTIDIFISLLFIEIKNFIYGEIWGVFDDFWGESRGNCSPNLGISRVKFSGV